MKNYLGIAALLGVIAFVSVTILAQADITSDIPPAARATQSTGQNAGHQETPATKTGMAAPSRNAEMNAQIENAAVPNAALNAAVPNAALNAAMQKAAAISPAAGDAAQNESRPAAPPPAREAVSPAVRNFFTDSGDCEAHTMKPDDGKSDGQDDGQGGASPDEQKAFMACMTAKGYSEDDVKARLNDDEGGSEDGSENGGEDRDGSDD